MLTLRNKGEMIMDLKDLQKHIRSLATLPQAEAPVISCYLNLEGDKVGYLQTLGARVRLLRKSLSGRTLWLFEEALEQIERYLNGSIPNSVKGLAIFARSGRQPFFLPLQFRVPLPNWVAVNTTPNIYHLVELKDTYDHYVVLIAAENKTRIVGINLGTVTEDVWRASSERRQRVCREWTKEHCQNHLRDRSHRLTNDVIRMLDRFVSAGGYGHVMLLGKRCMAMQIRRALPKHLAAKVVEVARAFEYGRTKDVVTATLASFIEQEERESMAVADKLLSEVNSNGLAVAGTHDSFEALARGQVDTLVLAQTYEAELGWTCASCGAWDVVRTEQNTCSQCGEKKIRQFNFREEMVRLAEQMESRVEVVNHSDALLRLGGVGCLLRFLVLEDYGAKAA